jgi:ABC-type polysaccharide/polyol phosphate export permease
MLFLHGLVIALSAINVRLRDTQHVLGNLLTFIFFLSPIIYPASSVPDRLKFTLSFNPFALFTICYQQIILDGTLPEMKTVAAIIFFTVSALLLGARVFNHYREGFAELL